jgi:hypothetical protein
MHLRFDAFQGLVLNRTFTEAGRIRKVTILTRMGFLENEGAPLYRSDFQKILRLFVEFGPDGNDLPRERDFPPFCLVKGRVHGQEEKGPWFRVNPLFGESVEDPPEYVVCTSFGCACACAPGSFTLVRDGAKELALMEALHEDADDHLRLNGEIDLDRSSRTFGSVSFDPDPDYFNYSAEQKEIFWLRFFLRRSRLRLTEAGFLRKGQRSRRLHIDRGRNATRIITAEESGLPGVVLAALTGCRRGIPRILACGAPAPGAAVPTTWHSHLPLGSHSQGWYAPEAFCAVSIGSTPRVLEGRITVPEERLADLFAWVRGNRGVLFHLWRMGEHQAAAWPLTGLRSLADCPDWIKKPDGKAKGGSGAFWAAVKRTLGDALRADEFLCIRLHEAMLDTTWLHGDGLEAGFSPCEVDRLIDKLRGEGGDKYRRWYTFEHRGVVHSEIALALEPEGWFWGWNDGELIGHSEADCDIRNDCMREYRKRRDYFPSEEAAEIALLRLKKAWNALTGEGKRARTGRRPSSCVR